MNRLKIQPMLAALALALLVPSLAFGATPVIANEQIIPSLDRISWSAVLAGAVVALAIHAGLSTLGIGIGAAAIDPQNRKHPADGVSTTLLVWMLLSGLIALFAGGWVSGRLAGTVPFDSTIHGIIMWSFATLLLLVLATTSAGMIFGGMFRLLGAGVSAAGNAASAAGGAAASVAPQVAQLAKDAAGQVLPQIDWKGIQKEAKKMLKLDTNGSIGYGNNEEYEKQNDQGIQGKLQDSKNSPIISKLWDDSQEVMETVTKAFGAVRDGNLANADRDELTSIISERAGVSREEANKTVDNWEKKYREVKQQYDVVLAKAEQKARDAATATKTAISRVALWTFASLLIGLVVSAVGGNLGSTYVHIDKVINTAGR